MILFLVELVFGLSEINIPKENAWISNLTSVGEDLKVLRPFSAGKSSARLVQNQSLFTKNMKNHLNRKQILKEKR